MILIFRFLFNILIFIFFSTQFNNNNNNKNLSNPWVQLNPCELGWVGLGWTYVMGWVGLNFFDPPWQVGSKNPFNLTHAHPIRGAF